jgi:hypothetical protein
MMAAAGATAERLDDQIDWYDRKSIFNQRLYKWLKIIEIVAAAIIPVVALTNNVNPLVIAGLGVVIIVLEGLQNINQFHHNWITYRSTCEDLKHEKFLWIARGGPYAEDDNPDRLLAERIESIISREHSKWVKIQEKARKDAERPAETGRG